MTMFGTRCLPYVSAALLMSVAVTVSAEMYRWVDENGRVHYSDSPPPPNAMVEKEIKSAPRPDAKPAKAEPAQAQKSYVEQEAEFRKRQVEKAEQEAAAQKAQQVAEAKKHNCEQARSQLTTLKTGGRIARTNSQGEREYIDDSQITQEIANAEKAVASWCN